MSKQDSIEKLYEDFHKETLKKLEAKHGKKWIEENKEKLEKGFEIFEDSGLL